MRRASFGFATAATMAVMLAGAPSASAQETLAASCDAGGDYFVGINDDFAAQNFIAQASGNLSRAEVSLARDAGTDDPFIVEIWTANADGIPVTQLASGTILAANVVERPDLPELVGVLFATQAAIVAGQQYSIVVHRDDGGWWVGSRADDECFGEFRDREGETGEWVEGNFDMGFRVFVTSAAPATCKGKPATIVGTDGDNEITGTDDRDVIVALGGNDDVRSLGANDLICGGAGRDRLRGGNDKDKLLGQAGKDTLRGQKGKDRLLGKGAPDKLNGGSGKDVCKGGKKDDSASKCEVEKSV